MKSQLETNLQDTCLFTSVILNGILFVNKRSTIQWSGSQKYFNNTTTHAYTYL